MNQDMLSSCFPALSEIPAEHRLAPVHQRTYLVDGELKKWTGPVKIVVSPVCVNDGFGNLRAVDIGSYPYCSAEQSEQALSAAVAAYDRGRGAWPTMSVSERIGCVEKFMTQMIARRSDVVKLLMWEIGKSISDSGKEFDRTVDYIRATIVALKNIDNDNSRFVVADDTIGQIRRTPLGVVLSMGPYNYPLNETFATLIPALIMGNTILLKPPKYGVLLFEPLLEAFRSAFPRGVINTVYGDGADVIPFLLESGHVNVLTLIGSSKIADHLKKLHPKANRLRAILGLDAKNAAIVLPDADIKLAVRECLLGSLAFNGQRCTALKMIIVHRDVADRFLREFSEEVSKLKCGMPWVKDVQVTPLPEVNKTGMMNDLVQDAVSKGAQVVNQDGGASCETLFFPAVVYPVKEGMRLHREEQFGPIVPVMPFDDIEAALDYVVTSEYGQQVSIFSSDPAIIAKLVDPLVNQVCRVNINCQCQRGPDAFPFSGRKDSAEGTLSVVDALRSFSIRSMIATKNSKTSQSLLDEIVSGNQSKFINTRFTF